MDETKATRSPPSGSEPPPKRQRLTSDQFDGLSDEEEPHQITPGMKAEIREELADLTNPKLVGDVPIDAEDDADAEVYGMEDESDDDEGNQVESKAGNQASAVRMVIEGEERDADGSLLNRKKVEEPPPLFPRTRTAAEIMQTMVVRRGLFGGDTETTGGEFPTARRSSAENAHQPQAHADQESGANETNETGTVAKRVLGSADTEKSTLKEKKKKRPYFNPRLWPEGRQEIGFMKMAHNLAKKGIIKCCETGVQLDPSMDKRVGTLWKVLRSQDEFDWREGSIERESREFLKACMRLGRLIEPKRLARLLGGKRRGEDYCRFALASFVGLLNVNKMRQMLRGGELMVVEDRYGDVVVNGDGMYSSDDELVKSMDTMKKTDNGHLNDAVEPTEETPVTKVEDKAPKNDEDDDMWGGKQFLFEVLSMSNQDDEKFASSLSYVMRTYLSDIVGCPISRFDQFVDKGSKLQMTFEEAIRHVCGESTRRPIVAKKTAVNRLKWLTESMPAPEMGLDKSFKLGTVDLWHHASKNFSVQQLARMSLIDHDRLLDWLTYVALESKVSMSDQEYNRERNVIVSIAPIPMLYLAEKAAKFAMKVLGVATHAVMQSPTDMNGTGFPRSITVDDIRHAAGWVLGIKEENRVAYDVFADVASDLMVLSQGYWPILLQRPLSTARQIVLSDRAPECEFGVPVNAVHEAKAVLDSLKLPVRRFLYAKENIFNMRDSTHFMPGSEQAKIRAERDAWRKKNALGKYAKSEISSRLRSSEKKRDREKKKRNPGIEVIDLDADELITDAKESKESGGIAEVKTPERVGSVQEVPCDEVIFVKDEVIGKDNNNGGDAKALTSRDSDLKPERSPGEVVLELLGVYCDVDDEFLCHNNAAELILELHGGRDVMQKRSTALNVNPSKELGQKLLDAAEEGLQPLLEASKNVKVGRSTSISYHRMAWICMRALGENVGSEDLAGVHMLGYGATANFTNFGVFGSENSVKLMPDGLDGLIQIVDQHVRREAETLMACAAHDDGRPWIDRADVILVHSIRKEEYHYGNVPGS